MDEIEQMLPPHEIGLNGHVSLAGLSPKRSTADMLDITLCTGLVVSSFLGLLFDFFGVDFRGGGRR